MILNAPPGALLVGKPVPTPNGPYFLLREEGKVYYFRTHFQYAAADTGNWLPINGGSASDRLAKPSVDEWERAGEESKALKKKEEERERRAKEAEQQRTRVEIRKKWLSNSVLESFADKPWTIGGFMARSSVSWIYGAPGSYKSFLAVDIACSDRKSTRLNSSHVAISYAV